MAFNGAGVFVRLYNWVNDRDANIRIQAARMDGEMDGIATGLSTCLTKDGQTVATARVPFALGLGLGDGLVGTPAINFSADTDCGFYRIGANNIGLSVNGAKVLDIATTGLTVVGAIAADTGTINGVAIVTLSATQTLTNKTLTSPIISTISNTGTLTLPTSTDTLVGRATTDTLTNKTLTSPTLTTPTINGATISGTFGGAATFSGALTFSAAMTYGGVTLTNAVTGTGKMVLDTAPTIAGGTFSGTFAGAHTYSGALTFSAALTYGGVTLSNAVTGTGNMVLSASPTFTGTVLGAAATLSGIVSLTNATDATDTVTAAVKITGGLGVALSVMVGGNVSIGTTSAGPGFGNSIAGTFISSAGFMHISRNGGEAILANTNADGVILAFSRSGTRVGSVSITTTTTTYNTTSDKTKKEDPRPFKASGIVDRLQIHDFRWKATGKRDVGIFAQDAFEVWPQAIAKPASDSGVWMADYSKFVPLLIADAQDVHARLARLEANLTPKAA